MSIDFRALCIELLLFAVEAGDIAGNEGLWPDCDPDETLIDRARAALAEPVGDGPSDEVGDVGELVADLEVAAASYFNRGFSTDARRCRRAAELLQQLSAAPAMAPIPVAERPWEREGWCDEQGRCWWFDSGDPNWVFDDVTTCRHWSDFSLPHHAIPLPRPGRWSDDLATNRQSAARCQTQVGPFW